jgi:broad specificity phosphatase PhoE
MTRLHVIRHGKAMAGAERYDQLHPLGEEQSRVLGRHFRDQNVHFDAIYCGPLVRQLDTLAQMRSAADQVGTAWPAAIILSELSEAPIEALAKYCMTERLATDRTLQGLVTRLAGGQGGPDASALFEALLAHVVALWISGEVPVPEIETAPRFGQRVRQGLEIILASQPDARDVAVITSNGVIGWLLGHAKNEVEPERRCLAHRVFNGSVSRFVVADAHLALEEWNAVDHLDDRLRTIL